MTLKTKEEIINIYYAHPYKKDDRSVGYTYDKDAVREMLDTYSELMAVSFAEWVSREYSLGADLSYWYKSGEWDNEDNPIKYSISQLFAFYKQAIK